MVHPEQKNIYVDSFRDLTYMLSDLVVKHAASDQAVPLCVILNTGQCPEAVPGTSGGEQYNTG
jgi:RecJ-like exonuclease